ncbi:MAG: 3-methyl-2-oxobutanoate hydroxymethyltransferase [Candidatus Margulisbacteria bacterium]|nr:3-methyl-2-oxobutanoate hydroxymethyltransferase [Candidatus Margulisiibacteriota bacterium]
MEKITVPDIAELKNNGRKIVMLTAYDYPFAKIIDDAGVDIILVGDSLGNVVLGYENTLPVSMAEMLHHFKAVKRGVNRALLVADFPLSGFRDGFANVKKLVKAGAEAVKIEGIRHLPLIKQCIKAGIPVMGHIGFTPQDIQKFGGARMQGKTPAEVKCLIKEAKLLEKTGVFALVVELTSPEATRQVTEAVSIPTISCGAGPYANGQVLVLYDLIGLTQGKIPSFAKQLINLSTLTKGAVQQYVQEVKK